MKTEHEASRTTPFRRADKLPLTGLSKGSGSNGVSHANEMKATAICDYCVVYALLFKHVPDGKKFFVFIRGQARVSSESLVRLISDILQSY